MDKICSLGVKVDMPWHCGLGLDGLALGSSFFAAESSLNCKPAMDLHLCRNYFMTLFYEAALHWPSVPVSRLGQ